MAELIELITKWQNEQDTLKKQISVIDSIKLEDIKYIGGVDISFEKKDPNNACVYLIVIKMPNNDSDPIEIVYEDHKIVRLTIPYISGFLAFREVPHYKDLLDILKLKAPQFFPQIILVDG